MTFCDFNRLLLYVQLGIIILSLQNCEYLESQMPTTVPFLRGRPHFFVIANIG